MMCRGSFYVSTRPSWVEGERGRARPEPKCERRRETARRTRRNDEELFPFSHPHFADTARDAPRTRALAAAPHPRAATGWPTCVTTARAYSTGTHARTRTQGPPLLFALSMLRTYAAPPPPGALARRGPGPASSSSEAGPLLRGIDGLVRLGGERERALARARALCPPFSRRALLARSTPLLSFFLSPPFRPASCCCPGRCP